MLSRVIAENVGDVFFETQCRYKIFIAMQPFKVEMIEDGYTKYQTTQIGYSHCHSGN